MQERYLGDSHDFLKYALLRRLHARTGMRLGVNWYLTEPEAVDRPGNNDGEKRHHLQGGVWQQADPDLFEKIHRFDNKEHRRLANVGAWELLPSGTTYFDQPVGLIDREAWQARALASLTDADLVFLDPDNGFEVKSATLRTRPKYAMYDEIAPYLDRGQAVVAIQFARQCDPVGRAYEVRDRLVSLYCKAAKLPVVRGRVAPNILFLSVAPAEAHPAIKQALNGFVASCDKAELIGL